MKNPVQRVVTYECNCQFFCAKTSLGAYWWGTRMWRRWKLRKVVCELDCYSEPTLPVATLRK